ncbi:hypothetical protein MLOOGBEN_23795 [Bacillus sp. EB106-08-02-XG196]|uniref:hypothetical protein n=1 Tax=Bacillus sp. EB106-08-02-XG196 TaxID=2737049 RepID=UPI0015C4777B|nr:hypothetical protein [Bacillus sp. EB106-08-02-XG196]NWQ43727.1 hypothetical protein [Bacillus sp. EB106-08-02-XG196]
MKKILTLLCTSLIVLLMFVGPGNPVQAEEPADDCTCHELEPLTGVERNKIVASFISTNEFKSKKAELISSGYKWNGAKTIEVILPAEGVTMIGVPFIDQDGIPSVNVFINGAFVGTSPM